MARAVIDVDQAATILDVADRITAAGAEDEIVVVGAAGAPWLRNAAFIGVARALAGDRRFALVTSDQRARSLAASVHVPAYASLPALDRHELDATEPLTRRRAARVEGARLRAPTLTRRAAGAAGSLLAAVLLVAAVVVPGAAVTVAPATRSVGPLSFRVSTVPSGTIDRQVLSETLEARVQGAATGSREETVRAKGSVRLSNRQTRDIRVPQGSLFRTSDNIEFISTQERTLPRSIILGPLPLQVGTVDVPVEAVVGGPEGNVGAGRITRGPSPNDYVVENREATAGGEIKKFPVVKREDYLAATSASRLAAAKNARAQAKLGEWRTAPPPGTYVVPRVYTTDATSIAPESSVVGKEVQVFDVPFTFVATAFAVPNEEPRRTAIERLDEAVERGFTLDGPSIRLEPEPRLVDDPSQTGVIAWDITISGSALASVNVDNVRRALAGRAPDEVPALLEPAGVRLEAVVIEPGWWPRMPLLDSRIQVVQVPGGVR